MANVKTAKAVAHILLIGGGEQTAAAVTSAFDEADMRVTTESADSVEDGLTALVSLSYQVCIVRGLSDQPEFALSICEGAKEAGNRVPIVVLMDIANAHTEADYLSAGALAALPWDGTQNAMLRNLVRLTVVLRKAEENLRSSNDRLVKEMITIQDERERAEAMNVQYVELAENYSIAKEELERLNQEKNKFFSIIAHDLRSPFTSLLGFTGLLETRAEKLNPSQVQDFARTVNSSAKRVFKLLENLLEWARLQMDHGAIEPTHFDVAVVAQKTVELLGPVGEDKGVAVRMEGDDVNAYADPLMIDTVIRNLVNNAIKFTPSGGTVTVDFIGSDDKQVCVNVSDTGVGMDPPNINKAFNLSDNVTTNGTNGEKGTGLGLVLCQELVARNGGQISVTSEIGNGSTFSFTVPRHAKRDSQED